MGTSSKPLNEGPSSWLSPLYHASSIAHKSYAFHGQVVRRLPLFIVTCLPYSACTNDKHPSQHATLEQNSNLSWLKSFNFTSCAGTRVKKHLNYVFMLLLASLPSIPSKLQGSLYAHGPISCAERPKQTLTLVWAMSMGSETLKRGKES